MIITPIIVALLACAPVLDRGAWEEQPYKALCGILEDASLKGGYAVFDCDNTTILNDVSHTLMLYQIENLAFADAAKEHFLHGLPRTDFLLESLGMTADEMGARLAGQYEALSARLAEGTPLEELQQSDEYLDFRAGFLAFYEAVCENYSYGEVCLWEPMLFSGLPVSVARQSLQYWLSQGRIWEEEWVSPDGRFHAVAEKGLVISQEMKNLYAALRRRGITPYICSASAEWLVEELACNPENGLGMPPENVFGLRFVDGVYDPGYTQSFMEGKVACIDSLIAPLYDGKQPVLVAGDSSGDIPMLTAYSDMRVGLIINPEKDTPIESLLQRGDVRYVSQSAALLLGLPAPVTVCGEIRPDRKDDLIWENEYSGYRAFGPALQAKGERAYGYDIFTKSVTRPVLHERYEKALGPEHLSFHLDHGDGMDSYGVGPTLGCGTAALVDSAGLVYPWCWKEAEILENGPRRFKVKLTFPPIVVRGKEVTEHRVITLESRRRLNRVDITYDGLDAPCSLAVGIVVHAENPRGWYADDKVLATADLGDRNIGENGEMYCAAYFPGGFEHFGFAPFAQPEGAAVGHVLGYSTYRPGTPFTYYFGSGWSKAGINGFNDWIKLIQQCQK